MGTLVPEEVSRLRSLTATGEDGMAALLLREVSISHERALTLGQRTAVEGLAHFLCESMLCCSDTEALPPVLRCRMAMTQDMLASILGLSSVHLNRCLMELRRMQLADLVNFELMIFDFDGLSRLASFDAGYLAAA